MSFSSDWLYTTKDNKDIVIALNGSVEKCYSEIVTDKGHDSFLLDEPDFKHLKGFMDSMYEKFKNEKEFKVIANLLLEQY